MAIKKLLIANRGEIAKRVADSATSMGITTVGIYSKDEKSPYHIPFCHEAYPVTSYLNGEEIVAQAQRARAQAVHPGYGFLSENADFAHKVQRAGLTFVGPAPEHMELMGSKKSAREYAKGLGLPVLEGHTLQGPQTTIPFPVLIKAALGGGGKGMRLVRSQAEFPQAFEAARREAANAFGDEQLQCERYLQAPRHIEVQVLSDTHGNHLHLFGRECSIQRRHQKIVEEAPTPLARAPMLEGAVKLTSSMGHQGAATVEFLVDQEGNFFFLEMNTRLQVEHPVTELITGVDLVREQIRIAQGQKISFTQKDLAPRGHALELRLCAENPETGFLPETGLLRRFVLPSMSFVRWDGGVQEGDAVGTTFDSLCGKIIVWGSSREEARRRALAFVNQTRIEGLATNMPYLKQILENESFQKRDLSTEFVAQFPPKGPTDRELAMALLARELVGPGGAGFRNV